MRRGPAGQLPVGRGAGVPQPVHLPDRSGLQAAAAVLIVARQLAAAGQLVERPEWERTLDKLLAGITGTVLPADIAPLGAGVRRRTDPGVPGVRRAARICGSVPPGGAAAATGCGRASAGRSWTSWPASYVSEHRELLLQLRAAAGRRARYSLPRSAWLSLSTVSTGFWALLDQAAHGRADRDHREAVARARSGPTKPAVVGLDARRDADGLELRPRISGRPRSRPHRRSACWASRPTASSG